MYLDPIADAGYYNSRTDALDTTRAQAEAMYAEMIHAAFEKDVQTVSNVKSLHVPLVSHRESKIVYQPLAVAVEDEIADPKAMAKLMEVLAKSPCALVQELRELLANQYADRWVSDLAEMQS